MNGALESPAEDKKTKQLAEGRRRGQDIPIKKRKSL